MKVVLIYLVWTKAVRFSNGLLSANKTLRILFAAIIAFAGYACEKDVILNLSDREGAYVVVETNITDTGSPQWVKLSYSTAWYDTVPGTPITGALVAMTHRNQELVFEEYEMLPGYYFNQHVAGYLEEGDYQLTIDVNGIAYTAQSVLRPIPVLDSVSIRINPFSQLGFSDQLQYDIVAHFEELPGLGDHYLFNLYVNDELRTQRPSDKSVVSDENLDPYVSLAVLSINANTISPNDTLTLEIRSISKEKFDFYNVFFFQTDLSGNPFAGAPPANIPTNLSEGARGFFQVSRVQRSSLIFVPLLD